ncbi:MAG: tyrosine-type recombinase/integrase [Anaerolineae bacterium]|nr:tyrosine-type recombinase/integrase [Anaerolineae bacterium]
MAHEDNMLIPMGELGVVPLDASLAAGFFDLGRALAGKSPETQRKYLDWTGTFYRDVLGLELDNVAWVPIYPFMETVTPAAVEAWLGGYAAAGHSKSGMGQARAAIVFFARMLVLSKLAPSSLWHDLRLVTLPDNAATAAYGESASARSSARWLSPAEVRTLIETAQRQENPVRANRDVALLWLMVTLGLRREEAAGLRWEYLTKRGGNWVLRVLGKRNKWRAVGVPLETVQALQPWAKYLVPTASRLPDGFLLRRVWRNGLISAEGITGNAVWRVVNDLWQQTGIPGHLAPHDLRRTAAAIALEAGATDREIQGMLGHSSIETTHRYLAPMRENTATYRIANLIKNQSDGFFDL